MISAPAPILHFRHVFAVRYHILLVFCQLALEERNSIIGFEPRDTANRIDSELETVHVVENHHVKRSRRSSLFFITPHVHVVVVLPAVAQPVNQLRVAVVSSASNASSLKLCGCSPAACKVITSTTLTTLIFKLGTFFRSNETAARISKVGTSPAQASTASGSPPSSLLAHFHTPIPAAQCLTAASISSHCSSGCFPATIMFT